MAFQSPTDAYTNANVAAMIPEVWSPIVNEPKFNNLTILPFVTDLTEYVVEGGDIVHVPDIYTNTFSVQTQSTQGAAVVDESVAQVDTTLTVNTHKYIAWVIGDLTMRQLASKYSLNEKYASEARNLLIQAVEDSLFGLWSSISTNTVGDTATVLTDLEIRTAINKLDGTNFELDQLAFFFHPTVYWLQLSGITKYYDHQVSQFNHLMTGKFATSGGNRNFKGTLYDIPVYTSSRVKSSLQTYRNLLLHKSAFGVAMQTMGGGMIRVESDRLVQNLATLAVASVIYGVAVLREPASVLINANTTATTS